MKLFFFLLFTVQTYLFALSDTATLERGFKYYKSQDYRSSYTFFSKIYLSHLSDIQFNFYFGRSAYETGHYEMALAAFERVMMQDSTNITNKLEMARTYYMLKMYKNSENLYREVLNTPSLPQNIKRNIEFSLAKVSGVQKKSFTYVTLMANYLYDSNINYGNLRSFEYAGTLLNGTDKISDTAFQLYANISNIYDIGSKNGFAIKNSATFFTKRYIDNNNFNVNYFSYNPSLIYRVTKYTLELALGADILEFGGKKYLTSYSFTPHLEFKHTNTLRSLAYFQYRKKEFTNTAQKDLDANRFELSYGLQNILTPRSYMQGNIFAISERNVRGNNIYVNFNELKINLNYTNQFTNKYGFDVFVQTRDRKYKDFSNGFTSTREDKAMSATVGVSMIIMQDLNARVSTSYEYVNSNQDQFSYRKQLVSASIIKTF